MRATRGIAGRRITSHTLGVGGVPTRSILVDTLPPPKVPVGTDERCLMIPHVNFLRAPKGYSPPHPARAPFSRSPMDQGTSRGNTCPIDHQLGRVPVRLRSLPRGGLAPLPEPPSRESGVGTPREYPPPTSPPPRVVGEILPLKIRPACCVSYPEPVQRSPHRSRLRSSLSERACRPRELNMPAIGVRSLAAQRTRKQPSEGSHQPSTRVSTK